MTALLPPFLMNSDLALPCVPTTWDPQMLLDTFNFRYKYRADCSICSQGSWTLKRTMYTVAACVYDITNFELNTKSHLRKAWKLNKRHFLRSVMQWGVSGASRLRHINMLLTVSEPVISAGSGTWCRIYRSKLLLLLQSLLLIFFYIKMVPTFVIP